MDPSLKPEENRQQSVTGSSKGATIAKPPVLRIYLVQAIVLLIVSFSLLSQGVTASYSILLGGLISMGPNAYFSRWAFRYTGAKAANDVARAFYRGEAGKFLLTTLLFAGAFVLVKPLAVELLFLGFVLMTALNWILAYRVISKR